MKGGHVDPDGKHIVWVGMDVDGKAKLYVALSARDVGAADSSDGILDRRVREVEGESQHFI